MQSIRTPAQHRAEVAKIMASLPANDNEITSRQARKSKSPKHGALADELRALKTWRRLAQANDGVGGVWHFGGEDGDELPTTKGDRELIGPGAMSRLLNNAAAPGLFRKEAVISLAGPDFCLVPVGSDIEHGTEYESPNGFGPVRPIIRMGGVSFAVGGEWTPAGDAARGQITKVKSGKGWKWFTDVTRETHGASVSEDITRASNDNLAKVLGTTPPRHIKRTRARRSAPSIDWPRTKAELRKVLQTFQADGDTPFAEARAFAGLLPAANDNRPALPCGSQHPLMSFVGMQATAKQEQVDTSAQAEDRLIEFQLANSIRKRLDPDHVVVLDAAIKAANFREIGELFGHNDKTAERRGKQLVYKAVGQLDEILKKMDAA